MGALNPIFAARQIGEPRILISESEYRPAVNAMQGLVCLLEIELVYDMLVANFEEFEAFNLESALATKLYSDSASWHWLVAKLRTSNRKLNNALSACRLYIDQTSHYLCLECWQDDESAFRLFEKAYKSEYDGNVSYRLMEALRNLLQHRLLPIKSLSSGGKIEGGVTAHVTIPKLSKESLLAEKIKCIVKSDIEAMPEYIEVVPHLASYVESLSRINLVVRKAVDSKAREWIALLEAFNGKHFCDGKPIQMSDLSPFELLMYKDDSYKEVLEDRWVLRQPIEHRELLIEKNGVYKDLAAQVVKSL